MTTRRSLRTLEVLFCLVFLNSFHSYGAAKKQSSKPVLPSSYKLIAVAVNGSKRFSSQDVAAASGLPTGTIAHEEDFKKAARQLGESGAFADISFSYTYSGEGTKLVFQVTDADTFVPARFSDFVWFSDDELRRSIHERVPLFNGELPATGRLPDQVSDVLQALLVEKLIAGHVDFLRKENKQSKLEAYDYNVSGISIRIHGAEFPGAGADLSPALQTAAEGIQDREYSRDYMENVVAHTLLPAMHEHGYLKATCDTPQPKVVKTENPQTDLNQNPRTYVDIAFPVNPGSQYKVKDWQWVDNKAIPTDALQPLIHLKAGAAANTVQLSDDLRGVQTLYGTRGYVTASVKADAEFDDANRTVSFRLDVNEGPVFHMGELEFRGLDNSLEARLRAAWKLRPGDVFDASYLEEFLPLARKLLPSTLDWEVTPHVTAIGKDKTVDVDLQYMAKAPR